MSKPKQYISTWKDSPEIIEALNTHSLLDPKAPDDDPAVVKAEVIQRLDAIFKARIVAEDSQDKVRELSLTKDEVCGMVIPELYQEVPWSISDNQDDEDVARNKEIREVAQALFWTYLTPAPTGTIQKALPTGLMLVETKVPRPVDGAMPFVTNDVVGRFYTSHPDLVLRYYVQPGGKGFENNAKRLVKKLRTAEDRFPNAVDDFRLGFSTYLNAAVGVLRPFATPAPDALNGNGAKVLPSKTA